jgi:trehalose-phosphatase
VTAATPAEVARAVGDVATWLVVLDFDGTLAPIVERKEDAALAPGAHDAVAAVCTRTEVAVVTGRPVDDVLTRLHDLPVTVIGNHGTQARLRDGSTVDLLDTARMGSVLDEVEELVVQLVDPADGWDVERKPTSVAVHDRRVPHETRDAVLPEVRAVLDDHATRPPGWKVLAGHRVTEFAPSGADKGTALTWALHRSEHSRAFVVGDDVTDEDAFRVAVGHDGLAVLVAETPRPSAATMRLTGPDAVVATLRLLAGQSTTSV